MRSPMHNARIFLGLDLLTIGWFAGCGRPWSAGFSCVLAVIHGLRSHPAVWAADHPTEAAARAWVEGEVKAGGADA